MKIIMQRATPMKTMPIEEQALTATMNPTTRGELALTDTIDLMTAEEPAPKPKPWR